MMIDWDNDYEDEEDEPRAYRVVLTMQQEKVIEADTPEEAIEEALDDLRKEIEEFLGHRIAQDEDWRRTLRLFFEGEAERID